MPMILREGRPWRPVSPDWRAWPVAPAVGGALAALALVWTLVSLAVVLGWVGSPHWLLLMLDVTTEANAWTWMTGTVLMAGAYTHAGAAYARWRRRRAGAGAWAVTAAIMAALSFDDMVALHERFLDPVGAAIAGQSGLTYHAWVVPGSVIALAIVGLFVRSIRTSSAPVRRALVLGLALFFGGAIGIEAVSAAVADAQGHSVLYIHLYHLEEACEAVGAAVLVAAGLAELPERAWRLGDWAVRERAEV